MDAARSATQENVNGARTELAAESEKRAPPVWLSHLWYEMVHFSGVGLFTLGFSMRVEGSRNMPPRGPVLVIANHQSFLDPWLAGMAVRRHLVYLARKTLFRHPLFAGLIRSLNAVPIDQEGVGKEGIKIILSHLRKEKAVLVFPEGNRTEHGGMQPFYPGIHLLIRKAESAIVPVGIAGAFDAYPRWRPVPIPAPLFLPPGKGTLAVSVGKPLDSRRFAEMPREQALAELYAELEKVQQRAEKLRRK
jgi:1-acyl-sn-glycerol-3-phosphate acyltransferase